MHSLPSAQVATHIEVISLISNKTLYGAGLGAIDVHIIASAKLEKATIWSRDKALSREARRLGIGGG